MHERHGGAGAVAESGAFRPPLGDPTDPKKLPFRAFMLIEAALLAKTNRDKMRLEAGKETAFRRTCACHGPERRRADGRAALQQGQLVVVLEEAQDTTMHVHGQAEQAAVDILGSLGIVSGSFRVGKSIRRLEGLLHAQLRECRALQRWPTLKPRIYIDFRGARPHIYVHIRSISANEKAREEGMYSRRASVSASLPVASLVEVLRFQV